MRYRSLATSRGRAAARCHRRISTRCSTPSESWQYESQRFLGEGRDWNAVKQALASAVAGTAEFPGGHSPISFGVAPPPPPASGAPRERTTWALEIAYLGSEFDAFTWQPDRERTVMGLLNRAIEPLIDGAHATMLSSAGRTDAGVSALAQCISFYSWPDLDAEALRRAVDGAAPVPGALRLLHARRVPRDFHATFSARSRQYAYLLPCRDADAEAEAARIDALLAPLPGARRDYAALGRGLPKGKDTHTTLRRATARAVPLVPGGAARAVRIDVEGDRFLRRMVRTLVASASWLAHTNAADDALLHAATSGDQRATAPAAPPFGLCLLGAAYGDSE